MKTKVVLTSLIVAALVFILAGRGVAFQNEPEGFRGLLWGDPPTEEMEYFDTIKGLEHYTLSKENKYLGDLGLKDVFYIFYGDPRRLFYVKLSFTGKATYERLKAFCRREYGEETSEGFNNTRYWEGETTLIGFDYDAEKEEGFLGLSSVSILIEIVAAFD